MKDRERRLAQEVMAALEQVELPANKDIYIQVLSDEIRIKITDHVYIQE